MAGPWDKYADDSAAPDAGSKPWEKYGGGGDDTKKDDKSSDFETFTKNALGAIVEPALKAGSAMIAKPVSDVAGLAATGKELISPTKGGGDPAGFKRHVQEALTYEPKTAAGQSGLNPLNAIPDWIGKGIGWAGDKAGGLAEKGLTKAGVSPAVAGPIGAGVTEGVEQLPGFIGAKGGAKLAEGLPAKQAALDAAKKIDAPKEAIRAAAKDSEHPYITPPEHGLQAAVAGLAGKTRVEKVISKRNSEAATNRFAKEVGIEEGTPLTPENIKSRIQESYAGRKAMEEAVGEDLRITPAFVKNMDDSLRDIVLQIKHNPELNNDMVAPAGIIRGYLKKAEAGEGSMSTKQILTDVSKLREQAKTHFRAGDNALGYSKIGVANQLEQLFEDNLKATGKADLVDKFKADRVLQAKLHFIEDVVTPEGKVDLSKVASRANSKRYKGALTGELKTAADFARTWKKAAQPLTGEADPRFSVFDGMLAAGAATASIATMNPYLMAPAAAELAGRYGVPGMAKRGMLQNGPPNYDISAMRRALPGAAGALGLEASQNRGPPPQ
jgi:hypothetical protein